MKLTKLGFASPRSLPPTFAALKHPNYRLWFMGQLVSLVGTWMQTTAQGYLVYELTHSPAYLGYVGFASGVPAWIFTLWGGVISDRVPRRTMLLITQSIMMILAFGLATLVFTNRIEAWTIIVMALLLGIANAFDAPARVSFVAELVERQDMTNAIALNSTMFNMATVVGPAAAGLAYALWGAAWCFVLNGLSFLAVIVALLLMRITVKIATAPPASTTSQLAEGFRYSLANPTIRVITANIGLVSMFGMSMMTLIPAWAVDVLGGDVTTNGLLLSSRGAGALIGALLIASLSGAKVKGKLLTIGSFGMPIFMLLFALTRWMPIAMGLLVLIGFSFMIQANTSNALVQMSVPDHLRGRVMSIYTLIFFGGSTIGSLLLGGLAARLSEPAAVMISSAILIFIAIILWLRLPFVRRLD